uniref:Flagellar protein FliL n=1 Tax=Fundidesulfovibrio putealis TaxID=270496 RepID=A0A7C4AAG2_9BACT
MADAKDVEEQPKKKKGKLLIIILLVVMLLGLGAVGYLYVYPKFFAAPPAPAEGTPAEGEKKDEKKDEKKEEKKDEKKKEEEKKEGKKDEKKPVTSLNNIVTNLADPGGRRYVRMSVEFDFKDDHAAKEFEEKYQARIKDTILTLLWSKTSEELSSVDGMIAFRTELQNRVNQIMGQGKVKQVFITDRVIQ